MKTWEMIKELTEDKSLRFVDRNGYVAFIRGKDNDSGILELLRPDSSSMQASGNLRLVDCVGGCSFKADEWELVRQEVDFMTAVNSGKRIRPNADAWDYMSPDLWIRHLLKLHLINGKWLIE